MMKRVCFYVLFMYFGLVLYAQSPQQYIVQKDGEALWRIAIHSYDSNVYPSLDDYCRAIAKWNNIDINNIDLKKDQVLWLVDPQTIKNEHQDSPTHEHESDGTISETTEVTPDSKAGQPIGDTNVTKEEPMPNPQPSPQINPKPNPNPRPNPKPKNPNDGPTPPRSYSWVWLLLGVLVGLVLGGVLVYLMFVKKLKTELEYTENELSRANSNLSGEKTKNNTELSRLSSKVQTLERENSRLLDENVSLGEEMDRLREAQSRVRETKTENTVTTSANQVSNPTTEPSTTLYADAIIDEYFVKTRETLNEDSIFVLHLNGENSADFSIHKSAYQRVLANPSFLEGCEKQILGDTMQLEILSEGKAQREASNGKWKVINKLNVIIR